MHEEGYGGRDCELSTTGHSAAGTPLDTCEVTSEILRHLPAALQPVGVRVWSRASASNYSLSPYSMDSLRHWTGGGQCYYGDMGHFEVCTACTRFPSTFAAQSLSTVLAADAARRLAQEAAQSGATYSLSTSNVDAADPAISFGTHLSMSVSTELWEDLFVEQRHPAILGFVSSVVAAAMPFFGAGYVLPLKDGSIIYSLSARAHHVSRIATLSTTEAFQRGLLNRRRESHAKEVERLHLIGFDYCLLSSALLFSLLQCALTAAEEGFCGLNLYDPVHAMRAWSWGMDQRRGRLPATATLVDGRTLTLPAYMEELATTLLKMCDSGLITEDAAPEARQLLPRIIDLARYAAEGSLVRCGKHLTWAAKLLWLARVCAEDGVSLGDPAVRLVDHDFANVDRQRGIIWRLWQDGLVDPLTTIGDATKCLAEGPVESRDWGRGRLIQKFGESIRDVDWSYIDLGRSGGWWTPRLRVELPHLDSLNASRAALIDAATDPEHLGQLLRRDEHAHARPSDPVESIASQLKDSDD